jgi:hypothetical protein
VSDSLSRPCTAFDRVRLVAAGTLADVALTVKAVLAEDPAASVLTFDDATGRVIDLDLRGSTAEIIARLASGPHASQPADSGRQSGEGDAAARGRGRPRLGVVAREVTLLPRHWEWLAAQRGGASAALRRLIDAARRSDGGGDASRAARDAAYRFMSALAGDLPGFEEASRALFADDRERFATHTATWPADVRNHARTLAWGTMRTEPAVSATDR